VFDVTSAGRSGGSCHSPTFRQPTNMFLVNVPGQAPAALADGGVEHVGVPPAMSRIRGVPAESHCYCTRSLLSSWEWSNRVRAIQRPSGETSGNVRGLSSKLSCLGSPPVRGIVKICRRPSAMVL
jgi:hypothetical protein